jgi:hypothetical protein
VAAALQEFVVAAAMYYLADYMPHIIRPGPITQDPPLSIAQARLPAFAHKRPLLLHRTAADERYTRAAAIRYKRAAAAPQEFVVTTAMCYLADYMLH